ncbi:hypothetical protein QJQ45_001824 [Haematococcus lacustris]|nr:hypothetical protein QJQ45_001824 [Haematococcus lacustris]
MLAQQLAMPDYGLQLTKAQQLAMAQSTVLEAQHTAAVAQWHEAYSQWQAAAQLYGPEAMTAAVLAAGGHIAPSAEQPSSALHDATAATAAATPVTGDQAGGAAACKLAGLESSVKTEPGAAPALLGDGASGTNTLPPGQEQRQHEGASTGAEAATTETGKAATRDSEGGQEGVSVDAPLSQAMLAEQSAAAQQGTGSQSHQDAVGQAHMPAPPATECEDAGVEAEAEELETGPVPQVSLLLAAQRAAAAAEAAAVAAAAWSAAALAACPGPGPPCLGATWLQPAHRTAPHPAAMPRVRSPHRAAGRAAPTPHLHPDPRSHQAVLPSRGAGRATPGGMPGGTAPMLQEEVLPSHHSDATTSHHPDASVQRHCSSVDLTQQAEPTKLQQGQEAQQGQQGQGQPALTAPSSLHQQPAGLVPGSSSECVEEQQCWPACLPSSVPYCRPADYEGRPWLEVHAGQQQLTPGPGAAGLPWQGAQHHSGSGWTDRGEAGRQQGVRRLGQLSPGLGAAGQQWEGLAPCRLHGHHRRPQQLSTTPYKPVNVGVGTPAGTSQDRFSRATKPAPAARAAAPQPSVRYMGSVVLPGCADKRARIGLLRRDAPGCNCDVEHPNAKPAPVQ